MSSRFNEDWKTIKASRTSSLPLEYSMDDKLLYGLWSKYDKQNSGFLNANETQDLLTETVKTWKHYLSAHQSPSRTKQEQKTAIEKLDSYNPAEIVHQLVNAGIFLDKKRYLWLVSSSHADPSITEASISGTLESLSELMNNYTIDDLTITRIGIAQKSNNAGNLQKLANALLGSANDSKKREIMCFGIKMDPKGQLDSVESKIIFRTTIDGDTTDTNLELKQEVFIELISKAYEGFNTSVWKNFSIDGEIFLEQKGLDDNPAVFMPNLSFAEAQKVTIPNYAVIEICCSTEGDNANRLDFKFLIIEARCKIKTINEVMENLRKTSKECSVFEAIRIALDENASEEDFEKAEITANCLMKLLEVLFLISADEEEEEAQQNIVPRPKKNEKKGKRCECSINGDDSCSIL